jgi:hypothetical protein
MEDADKPEVVRPANDVDRGLETWSMWDGITSYRVTDLWLFSGEDLTAMAAAFEARGLVVTNRAYWITDTEYWRLPEPQWHWSFQTSCGACEEGSDGPEPTIAAFLAAVEALDPPARAAWARCSHRVFDVAYDCGTRPHAVNHDLSAGTLARLAAVDATLRLTLYPLDPSEIRPAEPDAALDRRGT